MANPSSVAHLTTVHHPLDSRIYFKEARTLSRAGFDVWLLARSAGRTDLEEVHFVPLPDGRGRAARLRRQFVARNELRRLRPDLIHIHDPELLPLAGRLKAVTDARVIYDKHEAYQARTGVGGKVLRKLEAWGLQWVDHVIVAEDAYREPVERMGARCTVVLNYALPAGTSGKPGEIGGSHRKADHREADREKVDREIAPHPSRLVYTGTVSEGRGLFQMLDLAQMIKERGLNFTIEIAGVCNYPEQRAAADRRIRKEELGTVLSIRGWDRYADPAEIEDALRKAHIGLMLARPDPNYVVSLPTKFYEYMQYGLPMVVSDIPLWAGFVGRTATGVTVPHDDTGSILEALVRLQDPETYERYREAGLAHAEAYEWKQMVPRLLRAYAEVGGSVVSSG